MFDSFNVSNGVRLSPYLFAVYMDDLSSELNKINAGCIVGNLKLNHNLLCMLMIEVVFVLLCRDSTNYYLSARNMLLHIILSSMLVNHMA